MIKSLCWIASLHGMSAHLWSELGEVELSARESDPCMTDSCKTPHPVPLRFRTLLHADLLPGLCQIHLTVSSCLAHNLLPSSTTLLRIRFDMGCSSVVSRDGFAVAIIPSNSHRLLARHIQEN